MVHIHEYCMIIAHWKHQHSKSNQFDQILKIFKISLSERMTPVHFRTVFLKSRIKVSRIHFKNVCNFTGKDEYLKTENILGEKK